MPEVRGKLPKGSTGILRLTDDNITLWEERGFITKRPVKLTEFTSAEATSTQLDGSKPPFRKMYRLTIRYVGNGEEEEMTFYSDDMGSLETIKNEIDCEIERRRAAQELERRERRRIREAHIHQLTLMLELLDNVFGLVFELDGSVNWRLMDTHRAEVEEIGGQIIEISEVKTIDIPMGTLSNAIMRRLTDDIKRDCYALIEAVHHGSKELSSQVEEHSNAFNLELYELFVGAYLILWDLKMGEYLGEEPQEEELEELQACLEKLHDMVGFEGDAGFEAITELSSLRKLPVFEDIRSLIQQYLNYLLD